MASNLLPLKGSSTLIIEPCYIFESNKNNHLVQQKGLLLSKMTSYKNRIKYFLPANLRQINTNEVLFNMVPQRHRPSDSTERQGFPRSDQKTQSKRLLAHTQRPLKSPTHCHGCDYEYRPANQLSTARHTKELESSIILRIRI